MGRANDLNEGMGGSPTSHAEYLEPAVAAGLPWHVVPVVDATAESLGALGSLVPDADADRVQIVPWPVGGWRSLDPGTGIEGGTTTGIFEVWWEGETLLARNDAVGGSYLLGWSTDPHTAMRGTPPEHLPPQVLLWHANYHPDGGQVFFPQDDFPFVVLLAPPGDDVAPDDFIAFRVSGGQGLHIAAGVWHDAAFPLATRGRFRTTQGRVHGRVSCNVATEFGVLLSLPLHCD
jgi:ureidoglycolate lyase